MRLVFLLMANCLLMTNRVYSETDDMKTLRLLYPQWQGGEISNFIPELSATDAARGYYLGAHLLNYLAPQNNKQKTIEVPVSLDMETHKAENGVIGYQAILLQSKAALDILRIEDPDRIITLGGECSVSVVPFTYLAEKYLNDVAIVWIDAHPDLNLPYSSYAGYHAMALAMCLGKGDKQLLDIMPAKIDASKSLILGLRAWDNTNASKEHQASLGVKSLMPAEVANDSEKVLRWLKESGVSKVLIHFDLDALDPAELIAAVGTDPDGLKIETVVRIVNEISKQYDVVGMTIAEHMPRVAIKIKNMLEQINLLE